MLWLRAAASCSLWRGLLAAKLTLLFLPIRFHLWCISDGSLRPGFESVISCTLNAYWKLSGAPFFVCSAVALTETEQEQVRLVFRLRCWWQHANLMSGRHLKSPLIGQELVAIRPCGIWRWRKCRMRTYLCGAGYLCVSLICLSKTSIYQERSSPQSSTNHDRYIIMIFWYLETTHTILECRTWN
jgi:hypothetical protein